MAQRTGEVIAACVGAIITGARRPRCSRSCRLLVTALRARYAPDFDFLIIVELALMVMMAYCSLRHAMLHYGRRPHRMSLKRLKIRIGATAENCAQVAGDYFRKS